jgi:hypothetical protein
MPAARVDHENAGDGGSTTPYNDTWTDGQLFLKSRVASLSSGGGFAIAP